MIGAVCSVTTIIASLLYLAAYYRGVYTSYSLYCLFPVTLTLACNTLDHLDAILNTYPYLVNPNKSEQNLLQDPTTLTYWFAMVRLVIIMPSESELDPSPIDDLETAIRVLGPASRSWKTMAALFPVNLRQDLCLLYAFFRTADDLVDDAPTPAQCEANLVTIRGFLKQVFDICMAKEQGDHNATLPSQIDWSYYAGLLPNDDVLAIFRNFARISHYLCPRAMSELTDAWELDLRGEPVNKQNDLLNYAALISGTFGELCTCVIMYKTGNGNWGNTRNNNKARNDKVLSRARSTGQVIKLLYKMIFIVY